MTEKEMTAAKDKTIGIAFRSIGNIGGANNMIAGQAQRLAALGYSVDLLGEKVNRRHIAPELGRPVRISRLHVLRRYRYRWFAWQVQRHLQAGRYDFVIGHGHQYWQDVLIMHNCVHLQHELIHGTALDTAGTLAEIHDRIFAARAFKLCIVNSCFMRDELVRRYGLDKQQLPVVYPGYRAEQFKLADRKRHRAAVRNELGWPDRILIGLVTSGDFRNRGLDILLHAFAGLPAAQREQCMLLVLGKRGNARPYEQQARELGVAEQLHFLGATRQPERYLHALDFCVHPAHIETFGQTVQEALVCGIPVLSTRRVGAMELLPEDMRAKLPQAPDAASLKQQLTAMIAASAEQRHNMALRARQAFVANTVDNSFEQALQIFHQAGL